MKPTQWPHLAGLVVLVLVGLLAWPALLAPNTVMVGSGGDLPSIAWGFWRLLQLRGQDSMLFHPDVLHPMGASLLIADVPEAMLMGWVTGLVGPLASVNLLQILHPAMAAMVCALLARELGASGPGSLLGGLVFGLSPVLLSGLANGNPDVTPLFALALAGLAVRQAPRHWGAALGGGAFIGLSAWLNPYVGLMAAVVAIALCPRPRDTVVALRLAATALISLAIAFAFIWLVTESLQTPDSMVRKDAARPPGAGAAHLLGFVWPTLQVQPNAGGVHAWFLGLAPLVLAGVGLHRAPDLPRVRLVLLGLVGLVASLGSVLVLHGDQPAVVGGQHLALPWAALSQLPGLDSLQIVYRFAALPSLVVALCVSRAIGPGAPRWAAGAAAVAILLELGVLSAGRLVTTTPLPPDGACAELQDQAPGAVVDLPADHGERWMLAQTCHKRPIAQGINRPFPPQVHRALRGSPDQAIAALGPLGYRWLVMRPDQGEPGEQVRQARLAEAARTQGLVVHDSPGLVLIDLGEPTP